MMRGRVLLAVRVLAFSTLLLGVANSAWSQEPPPPPDAALGAAAEDIVLELGGGGLVGPAYEGADDYLISPLPFVRLHYLRLPHVGAFGGGPEAGLSIGPSFRFVPERDDDDYSELEGLGDVDAAFELGGTISYRLDMWRGFATARHGFGGHDGIVGELGVDAIVEPTSRLTVSAGPRLHFADSDYLDTYLGVTAAQSAASGLSEFDPDGGLKGVGVEAEARFALTPRWSIVGSAGYERLVGDAADSPITEAGSENQFTAALGLTYRFGLDFFD
jgi:outer membrane scaffolding protein for murein synthesis (MipA/OmpV family)